MIYGNWTAEMSIQWYEFNKQHDKYSAKAACHWRESTLTKHVREKNILSKLRGSLVVRNRVISKQIERVKPYKSCHCKERVIKVAVYREHLYGIQTFLLYITGKHIYILFLADSGFTFCWPVHIYWNSHEGWRRGPLWVTLVPINVSTNEVCLRVFLLSSKCWN